MEKLLKEIVNCENWVQCLKSDSTDHPCSKIVSGQKVSKEDFQLPEPWSGNIEEAPILFISSNPGISKKEEYPLSKWLEGDITDFFINRFSGGKKQWVKNNLYTLLKDDIHEKNWVRFWAAVRKRAVELLGDKDAIPGKDYAITELVHCKSSHEIGVREALPECARLYMKKIFSISKAKVIVCLGEIANETLKRECKIDYKHEYGFVGPIMIGEVQRYLLFLPHPNARMKRKVSDYIADSDLQIIKKHLFRGNDSYEY